ncbi:TetR/AcrR family transcriptional regulator [Desulfolithobacter sp.]
MNEKRKGEVTREHILRQSRRLFTLRGFQNTSINAIMEATGVKKGNLYYHFPSKEALGLAVLLDARDEFFQILEESLQGEDPLSRVVNSCRVIMELMQEANFVGGCLFGNTALEMTDTNSRFAGIIREVFSFWSDLLEKNLRQAVENGLLASPIPAPSLATAVVAIMEGGIMISRVYKNRDGLEDCLLAVRVLLGLEE